MNWSIHTHNMRSVSSFAQATRVWESAEPFAKTVHTSWKPLDGKRQPHKRIVKLSEDRGYDCVLYNTAIASYYPDGSVKLGSYDSMSTRAFAYVVAPDGCYPESASGKMYWRVTTDDGPRYYREGQDPLILHPTAAGNWVLMTTPATVEEWVYDPQLGGQVQKQLRPYSNWHRVAIRMGVTSADLVVSPAEARHAAQFLGDIGRYPEIAERLGRPERIREALYIACGARYKSPAPHTRLPRNIA